MIVPDSIWITMKYSEYVTPLDVSGTFTEQFYLNGPFMPNAAAVTSCIGWNEWSAFYQHYFCAGSKIQVQFLNGATDTSTCVVYPSTVSTFVTTIDEGRMQPYAKVGYAMSASVAPKNTRMTNQMSVRKLEAWSVDDLGYSADFDALPQRLRYWNIMGDAFDGTVNNITIQFTLWYRVKWYRRIPQLESVIPVLARAKAVAQITES